MTFAIATLYAASLIEMFLVGALGVRVLMPEQPVKHGVRYSGAARRQLVREQCIRDTARAEAP
ncbi:hypothetical protein ACFVWY_14730 [Streptomyces sp. NPDC058195]|uniref:hypothetical protein n=1 Tax=Streptomyces sp. NPDC058195 TaxID=3346375 RepID=UPI0036ECFD26